ncbi:MAG: elongation factor G [Calditrichales bacterium]|nr:MAG: elongation factor G [Calditrichales bacterium]
MKTYKTEQLRNLSTGAHGGAGKTSLIEAILFNMGVVNRIGTVELGSTVSDYNADEIERQISINTALVHGDWNDHKLNLIDTPGYSDFFGEVVGAFRAVESIMVVVSASGGVEVGTEMVWEEAKKLDLPRLIVINKLDKENLDYDEVLQSLQESFGHKVVSAQFPVNVGPGFDSIVDLIRMKLMKFATDGSGKFTEEAIPDDLREKADDLHLKLIEAVAESDDSLMERYFEAGELTEDEFRSGLRKAILEHEVYPVFCTSAIGNIGVKRLIDVIANFAPAPCDAHEVNALDKSGQPKKISCSITGSTAALIFKTISEDHVGELSYLKVFSGAVKSGDDLLNSNQDKVERIGQLFCLIGKNKESADRLIAGDIGAVVKLKSTHTGDTLCEKAHLVKFPKIDFPEPKIRAAIIPKAKGDEEKISMGLHNLHEEDPTFISRFDPEIKQTIISGQGEMHLSIILKRLSQKYHVEVDEEEPKIPYREAIKISAEAQGKYKKQSGGRGQYGDCWLRLEKQPRGEGFEFVDGIVGGVIPGKFVPAVEKGVIERMEKGVIAGYPVVDVKVTVFDGSYHTVDSSEMAFKVASSMGFKAAFLNAKPILLEPIYDVTIKVPEEFMGDVMGDVSGRRGKIMGMDSDGKFQIIRAKIPLSELYKYSTNLRSMTSGRGIHSRAFSHYDEVPGEISEKIIEQTKKDKEEES